MACSLLITPLPWNTNGNPTVALRTLELVWSAEDPVKAEKGTWRQNHKGQNQNSRHDDIGVSSNLHPPKRTLPSPPTAFIDHWEYILSEILTYILHMHPEVVAGVVRRTYCRSKVKSSAFLFSERQSPPAMFVWGTSLSIDQQLPL